MSPMRRREFLALAWRVGAVAALGGHAQRLSRADEGTPGPKVWEIIRRPAEPEGYDDVETGQLLDAFLPVFSGTQGFPLDVLSGLFPEDSVVRIVAGSEGVMTRRVAAALTDRFREMGLPGERLLAAAAASAPAGRAVAAAQPQGAPPLPKKPAHLRQGAEGANRIVSVLAPASDAGAPPVWEPFTAIARTATDWAPRTSRRRRSRAEDGVSAARLCADSAVLPKSGLHCADLWELPTGAERPGEAPWRAGTLVFSLDAVALARVVQTMLTNARQAHGLAPAADPPALTEAARLGLGEDRLNRIVWLKYGV